MSTRYSGSPYRSTQRTYITPPGPADIAIPTVDLTYFAGYKTLGTREYVTAFGITALAEVILDRVLSEMPDNPWPLLATVCKEWQDKAVAEAEELYGENAMSKGRSPSPSGLSLSSPGIGVPTHPPPLPWTQHRPFVPPIGSSVPTTSNFRTSQQSAQQSSIASYWANSAASKTASGFTFACKDYVQRQRIACVLDEWFFAVTTHKPFSPALFSHNYFKQRAQMRVAVKQEEELGTQLTAEERRAAKAILNRIQSGGITPPPPGSGTATPADLNSTLRRGASVRSPVMPSSHTAGFGLTSVSQAEVAATVAKRSNVATPVALGTTTTSNKSTTPVLASENRSVQSATPLTIPVEEPKRMPTPVPTPFAKTGNATPTVEISTDHVTAPKSPVPVSPSPLREQQDNPLGEPLFHADDRVSSSQGGGMSPLVEVSARTSPGLPLEGTNNNSTIYAVSLSPTALPATNKSFPSEPVTSESIEAPVEDFGITAEDLAKAAAAGAQQHTEGGIPLSEAIVL